jgi:phytoene synthase
MTLVCLPKQRRQDMYLFYAFCRVVDDIADDPDVPVSDKKRSLQHWRDVLSGTVPAADPLETGILDLMGRYAVPAQEMLEIVIGVSTDLTKIRYETMDELLRYCHRVASCVGLVSIRIFGCTQPESRWYAEELGYALQLTNILRDVRQDYENGGRIYLPAEEMRRHGVTENHFKLHQLDGAMLALLKSTSALAREYYAKALAQRTREDTPKLRAAESMRRVYSGVLTKMEKGGFRVFEKRYRLSKPAKLGILGLSHLQGLWLR